MNSSQNTVRWLLQAIGRKKVNIVLLVALQAGISLIALLYAWLYRNLIDSAVAQDGRGFVIAAIMLGLALLTQISLRAWVRYAEEDGRASIENSLKHRLFGNILHKAYYEVAATHSGEWMNRLTSDTKVVAENMIQILPGMIGMLIRMVGAVVLLIVLQPLFAYVIIPGGILLLVLTFAFRRTLKRLHKEIQEQDGDLRIFLQERLTTLMVLKAFGREEQTLAGADAHMESHRTARMRRNFFSNICNIGFGLLMNGAYILSAVYCAYGLLHKTISFGTLTAVMQLVSQVQNPFANLSGYLPKYYAMLASAERLMEAEKFAEDVEKSENRAGASCGSIADRAQESARDFYQKKFLGIGLDHVSFHYPDMDGESLEHREALAIADCSLEIRKGQFIGIVGASGCGKSSLLKILMCFYPIQAGERYLVVRTDKRIADVYEATANNDREGRLREDAFEVGVKERKVSGEPAETRIPLTSSWRGLFAYVPQGNHLMNGTIREAVAFGDPEGMKQEERIWQALRSACADDFVQRLPEGLETMLGEHGAGLSEGQIQRIAIARALFADRPILLLDEATSSLDTETEQALLDRLRTTTDRTVLIVTHRPAALAIVDQVIECREDVDGFYWGVQG